jgi:outer membrane protein
MFKLLSMNMTLVMLTVIGTVSAQDTLSLRDAVRLAMQRSNVIPATNASSDAAAARISQARSGYLPKANYAESWARSDNPVFVFSSLLAQRQFGESNFGIDKINRPDFLNNFQSLVTVDQPLYDAGKSRRAVRTARLGKTNSQEEGRRNEMEVIAEVLRDYYDVLLGMEQMKVTTQAMGSADADLDRAVARRANGMATDADVLSIRVHIAAIREEHIRRNAEVEVARAAMNDAIGLALDTEHTLTTPLVPLSLAQNNIGGLETRAVNFRPEAQEARLAKKVAGIRSADARGNYLPQVTLHGAFEADRQKIFDRGGVNWLVSVGLRWNLFNGYADKARIVEEDAVVRRRGAEQARTESGIRLQVRQAWAGLKSAQERIDSARASVAEAEESLRISQNRFAAGLTTVTDLLRTEVALLQTQSRYLAAVHDQRIAAAMLDFAAGTLNADSEVLN